MKNENQHRILVKTRRQIPEEYGIHERTYKKSTDADGNLCHTNQMLKPIEHDIIYSTFGNPFLDNQQNSTDFNQ